MRRAFHALKLLFLKNAQHRGLSGRCQFSNFVEEYLVAVGGFSFPIFCVSVPVNAPFSRPNSALPIRVGMIAAQFSSMKGLCHRMDKWFGKHPLELVTDHVKLSVIHRGLLS